jgi:transmembrane sensor
MHNGHMSARRQCRGRGRSRVFAGIVLAVAALLSVDSARWLPTPAAAWIRYVTPVGEQQKISLQDGSTLDLNTGSEIKVRITARKRQFVLVHGEVLFNVATRPDWPFELTAGAVMIRSVSARLSVRLREAGETDVLVITGSAALDPGQSTGLRRVAQTHSASATPLNMSAGEWISMNTTAVLGQTRLAPMLMAHRTAWADGWLWFTKTPLPEAVAEFNRYHRQQLVLVSPSLASLEIGGRFRSTDLESFLATLEHSFNVERTSSAVSPTDVDTIYLRRRCRGAQQQCNWPLVQ